MDKIPPFQAVKEEIESFSAKYCLKLARCDYFYYFCIVLMLIKMKQKE